MAGRAPSARRARSSTWRGLVRLHSAARAHFFGRHLRASFAHFVAPLQPPRSTPSSRSTRPQSTPYALDSGQRLLLQQQLVGHQQVAELGSSAGDGGQRAARGAASRGPGAARAAQASSRLPVKLGVGQLLVAQHAARAAWASMRSTCSIFRTRSATGIRSNNIRPFSATRARSPGGSSGVAYVEKRKPPPVVRSSRTSRQARSCPPGYGPASSDPSPRAGSRFATCTTSRRISPG